MIVVVLIVSTLLMPCAWPCKPETVTRNMATEEECIAEAWKYLRAKEPKALPAWTTYSAECRVTVEPAL